ncbi:MAG: fatty acid desaturase family protein [Thermoleophilaceae bacterium]
MPTEVENPINNLTAEQLEAVAREFDAIHDDVFNDLGERDAAYIRTMIDLHRRLALIGRVLLVGSRHRPLWLAGTATLSVAKILENMEIGHNVMHGQWDWMNDPVINSTAWDWDSASTAEAWKHSHNYVHHTFANIRGKDNDLGYEIMRIDPHQKWNPVYLAQPFYNLVLMGLFEWAVAFHDLDKDAIRRGEKSMAKIRRELKGMVGKAKDQIVKDYVAFPLLSALLMAVPDSRLGEPESMRRRVRSHGSLRKGVQLELLGRLRKGRRRVTGSRVAKARDLRDRVGLPLVTGPTFKATVTADVTANVLRNMWAHAIIFCGHFPDQTYTFSQQETDEETRGERYVRQLIGAANIEGGPLFHVMSGNLGYQVEHHLFPDMPSTRYGEIAPRVRDVCERYGLPYNTGPFFKQWAMVNRTILRLALPGGKVRPKPGPYRGEHATSANGDGPDEQSQLLASAS